MNANHGGGCESSTLFLRDVFFSLTGPLCRADSYRLCPLQTASQPPGFPIDEVCFQSHPLDFVGETQWYQFGANRTSRRVFGDIKAVQTATGTWPEGSMWRRNPIPACHSPNRANGYSRGGANQTFFPNKGGPVSCSKEAFRCPPKGIDDPTPTAPCDPEVGDSSKFAFDGLYDGAAI